MNLEDVSRYIQQPSQLTLADAQSLKNMSEKHPYAAVFSLLYLTALANGKSIDLEHALQEHAYRLSDRTKLYYLVHQEITSSGDEISESVAEPVILTEVEAVEPANTADQPFIEAESSISTATESPAENDAFITETVAFTLEQEYIPESVEPVEESVQEEAVQPEPSTVVAEEKSPVRFEEPVVQTEQKVTERRSFTSWLKSNHAEAANDQSETDTPATKLAASDIIDRFIAEEPSISRPKNEFFSPPKKAKESLDENAIPVSETLAKIYAAQGNYPKAIHVYHQLMLAFPEKKLLFAVRIEELKKKITT